MFCKWCGATLKPTDTRCPGCKRESPPLSRCDGFFDLVPEARARMGECGPMPQPAPAPQPAPRPTKRSPVPVIALGVVSVLLLASLILLVHRGREIASLEKTVESLEAQLAVRNETPDSTLPQEPVESTGEPTDETAPAPTTNQGNTNQNNSTATEPPASGGDLTPEPSLGEGALEFVLLCQNDFSGEQPEPKVTLDGQPAEGFGAAFTPEEAGWTCTYSLGTDAYINLTVTQSEETVAVSYGFENGGGDYVSLFGQSKEIDAKWDYVTEDSQDAVAFGQWRSCPEETWDRQGLQTTTLNLPKLRTELGAAASAVSLRCTITRTNTDGGTSTFVVENIPVTFGDAVG